MRFTASLVALALAPAALAVCCVEIGGGSCAVAPISPDTAIFDPDVFVLGGGMSNVGELYERLPGVVAANAFGGDWRATIVPARWGDSSGVRGAARLWSREEAASAR